MIKNSFIFLDKISFKKEKFLWDSNIKDWNSFIKTKKIKNISKKFKTFYDLKLKEASNALIENNSSYFYDKFSFANSYRLFDYFSDEAVFIDIEVTGVKRFDDIIAIGLFDGFDYKLMIKNVNLDMNFFFQEMKKYKIIVSFNGSCFDIPFIKKRYKNIIPKIPIIDLKYLALKLGFSGGLKNIEKQLKINRNIIVNRIRGGDPYRLWKMYFASGDKYYLKILKEYNEYDTINLKDITTILIKKMKEELSFKI
ncbi:MAG: ribonuclease H-like domain-containing protein [Candidatus Woesearchaeota archaeon]